LKKELEEICGAFSTAESSARKTNNLEKAISSCITREGLIFLTSVEPRTTRGRGGHVEKKMGRKWFRRKDAIDGLPR